MVGDMGRLQICLVKRTTLYQLTLARQRFQSGLVTDGKLIQYYYHQLCIECQFTQSYSARLRPKLTTKDHGVAERAARIKHTYTRVQKRATSGIMQSSFGCAFQPHQH